MNSTAPKIGIITQARMTSTRLPGKVLLQVAGRSLLDYHVDRLKTSGLPVILATTDLPTDDPLQSWAERKSIPFFRGSESDVLSRFFFTAQKLGLGHVIRVTSDCPLVDGQVIGTAAREYLRLNSSRTYFSNCMRRTYPRGFDFEIFSFEMLREAHENAREPFEREHVTPYFYRSHPEKFENRDFVSSQDRSALRLTVDQAEDFGLIQILISKHGAGEKSYEEILAILDSHPELSQINAHVEQKKLERLKFRRVQPADSDMLLRWRNDPETQRQSIQTGAVDPAEHAAWFQKTLGNPSRQIWIAEHQDQAIGWVRRDQRKDGTSELSWTVSPDHRGKGWGGEMLSLFVRLHPSPNETARVKEGNQASVKMAMKAGFVTEQTRDGIIHLVRK